MTKYKLVIAEKPSVGMAYAVVLGENRSMFAKEKPCT